MASRLQDRPETKAAFAQLAQSLTNLTADCEKVLAWTTLCPMDRTTFELLRWHLSAAAGLLAGKPADVVSALALAFHGGPWPRLVATAGSVPAAAAYAMGAARFALRLGLSPGELVAELRSLEEQGKTF